MSAPALDEDLRTVAARCIDQATGSRVLALDQDNVKKGLGKLVLMVVELLRELLERQAIRRMDSGTLAVEQVERLGNTFLLLSEQIDRLKIEFGLTKDEFNLDLGPLGVLL